MGTTINIKLLFVIDCLTFAKNSIQHGLTGIPFSGCNRVSLSALIYIAPLIFLFLNQLPCPILLFFPIDFVVLLVPSVSRKGTSHLCQIYKVCLAVSMLTQINQGACMYTPFFFPRVAPLLTTAWVVLNL